MKTIIIASIVFIMTISCRHSNNDKKEETQNLKDFNKIGLNHSSNKKEPVFWYKYNRLIGILSIKYNISDTIVEVIFMEYMKINYPIEYALLGGKDSKEHVDLFKPDESILQTTNRMNKRFGIKKTLIGSIIYDIELEISLLEK